MENQLDQPIKKIIYYIEKIITFLIKIHKDQSEKIAQKYIYRALQLPISAQKRKFYLLNVLLPFSSIQFIIQTDQNLIEELMKACGDFYILPSGILLSKILERIFKEICNENPQQLRSFWEKQYFQILQNSKLHVVKGLINTVNPILVQISKENVTYMVQNVLNDHFLPKNKNQMWLYISFLKLARENSLIQQHESHFSLQADKDIIINKQLLEELILCKDRNVVLNTLEFLISHPKPSQEPSKIEFDLIELFLKYGIRTSYAEYRKGYLCIFKRFLERLRLVFENYKQRSKNKKELINETHYINFQTFLKNITNFIFSQLYPEVSFELGNPCLELINYILQNFPQKKPIEYKKGEIINPSQILQNANPDLFSRENFEILLVQTRSMWESIRILSINILKGFQIKSVQKDYIKKLYIDSLELCKSPIIKNYECGANILMILYENYLSELELTPEMFIEEILQKVDSSFLIFKQSFLNDNLLFQQNLIHGYITLLALIIKQISNQLFLKKTLTNLFQIMSKILNFTTQISSETVYSIFTQKENNDNFFKNNQLQIDCRGHIVNEKAQFVQNMQKILQGNTLLEALKQQNEQDQDENEEKSENLLVVAFYLISREAGFLFQTISNIVKEFQEQQIEKILEKKELENLVNEFFIALINIKHLGSIDRIQIGLGMLCRTMNESKNPILPQLSSDLLQQLLDNIENNTFKNVLRRSAGLPSAVVCLLKAEIAGNRQVLLNKTVKRLLEMVQNPNLVNNIKIHSLNILKKIFEDGNIKMEVDKHMGEGFEIAIKGFSIEDWSIRNSSLMLFSALCSRVIGGCKNPNAQNVKSKLNVVEFFARVPCLLDFFQKELQKFVFSNFYENSQYPPIYPIGLLLSRLLPYDLKNQIQKKNNNNNDFLQQQQEDIENIQVFISVDKVKVMLPLIILCAKNKNYMGRVMLAKAVLPFLNFENIHLEAVKLLRENIQNITGVKKDHNFTHGVLLMVFFIIQNYYFMCEELNIEYGNQENLLLLQQEISKRKFLILDIQCPVVQYTYLDIVKLLQKNLKGNIQFQQEFNTILQFVEQFVEKEVQKNTLRITNDMGHSVLRKKILRFHLDSSSLQKIGELLIIMIQKYENKPEMYKEEDNEFLRIILKYFLRKLKKNENFTNEIFFKQILQNLQQILENQEKSHVFYFTNCIQFLVKILFKIASFFDNFNFQPFVQILISLEKKFYQNGLLIKQLIKFSGFLIQKKLLHIDFYLKICEQYSSSTQLDFLRIAVIKSLKISMKTLLEDLKYEYFLNFSNVFLRLLQDEVPEIRQKMSSFISKYILGKNKSTIFEYTLKKYYSLLVKQCQNNQQQQILLFNFLLKQIFHNEYFSIKKTNHFENRIFAYDKANKFIDDMRIKKYAFKAVFKLLVIQKNNNVFSSNNLEMFVQQNKSLFQDLSNVNQDRIQQYQKQFQNRDEVIIQYQINILIYFQYYYLSMNSNVFQINICIRILKIIQKINKKKLILRFQNTFMLDFLIEFFMLQKNPNKLNKYLQYLIILQKYTNIKIKYQKIYLYVYIKYLFILLVHLYLYINYYFIILYLIICIIQFYSYQYINIILTFQIQQQIFLFINYNFFYFIFFQYFYKQNNTNIIFEIKIYDFFLKFIYFQFIIFIFILQIIKIYYINLQLQQQFNLTFCQLLKNQLND
ncbi:thyroid adenoma associated, putative [Ichthyophthirius multifiliis]|uniref:Thyroid adenoma associated, putative n=1 Tax=Ichthyophthirius multifiliis TaxID=5932 RepID=G0QT35_ICHMU|nr:thyroid adenoma associated, putative [Ichthyophthirius multifiliis]EGR31610.1 thyroid adenoma associated, putative [Ichthyophthirius multifiliis]|eukprot:XP_004035096.1 thyroid adenoma associated, putative [Ichthyophthirius multifiliis]